jgi:CDP-2,3-bis-(O-geranylgeranyl)-sn-glycerol synthase
MTLTLTLTLKVMLLALAANGAPILGARLLGKRFAWPLDGGRTFADGRPLLGASKTVRGVVLSLLACSLLAPVLGFSWLLGLTFAAASMAGDAASSFVKRRLDVPPSGRFMGLDQIPEALLPLWVCREGLGLDWLSVAVLTVLFLVGSLVLSRVAFHVGLKQRPY